MQACSPPGIRSIRVDLSVAYGLGQDFPTINSTALHFSQRWVFLQSRSRQFGPVPISTTTGTASLCTFLHLFFHPVFSSLPLFPFTGSSNRSSSCTCKIIFRGPSFSSCFNLASIENHCHLDQVRRCPLQGRNSGAVRFGRNSEAALVAN